MASWFDLPALISKVCKHTGRGSLTSFSTRQCRNNWTTGNPWDAGPSRPGPDRIQDDIAAQLLQVGALLDYNGFETPLKDMPYTCVATVEFLRVDSVQLPHALRKVFNRCLDQEVIVIAHEAISMANPVVALYQIDTDGEK